MSIYKMYFSPTGRTQHVIDELVEPYITEEIKDYDLSCPVEFISQFNNVELTGDDILFLAAPSYGGYVPVTEVERLKNLKGNNTRAVIIATYGQRAYDNVLMQLKDILNMKGFRVIAAVAAVTEHSVSRSVANKRPDLRDMYTLSKFAEKIKEHIEACPSNYEVDVPGTHDVKERKYFSFKPIVNTDKCDECGLCSRACPVGAIPANKPSTTHNEACISCMRCIEVCPKKARHIDEQLEKGLADKLNTAFPDRKEYELYL